MQRMLELSLCKSLHPNRKCMRCQIRIPQDPTERLKRLRKSYAMNLGHLYAAGTQRKADVKRPRS